MSTRRQFLKTTAAGGMSTYALRREAFAFSQSPTNLRKFVQALPGLGPSGRNEYGMYIPVAVPDTTTFPGSDYYKIDAGQYTEKLHPDLPKATSLWGYADGTNAASPDFKYLGPIIVAHQDRPVRLSVTNKLPAAQILPVDTDPFFVDAQAYLNKISVHLHGGFVPWISDGGPYSWWTPANPGVYGPDRYFVPDMPAPGKGSFTFYYPNQQSSRLLWYHDHAHDLTRLNVYAGLASAYILRDNFELELIALGILPSAEIPLVIQDKTFKSANPKYVNRYPEFEKPIGDLWYPYLYEGPPIPPMKLPPTGTDTGRWDNKLFNGILSTVPSVVPEAFMDTIMVNGAVYPYLNVQQKRYRFRILNAAQARFFNLQLYVEDSSPDGITLTPKGVDNNGNPLLVPTNKPGPAMLQIGNECGFLPLPVILNDPPKPIGYESSRLPTNGNVNQYTLLLGSAERADVIIDFSEVATGTKLLLYNDAPAPFPGGDIRNDYYTGDYDLTRIGGAPPTRAGYGPDTRTLMQFRVIGAAAVADPFDLASTIAKLNAKLPTAPHAGASVGMPASPPNGLPIRNLTLNEIFDDLGRLTQLLGTDTQLYPGTYGRFLTDAPTETPEDGSLEIWRIFNYTADTHPVHFHLVNARLLSRQAFDTTKPPATSSLIPGTLKLPDLNELGFKETIRFNPGEATTMLVQFSLPSTPFPVPLSTRTNVAGYEYFWHCHILEHEEHDMMRPLIVVP